MQVPYVKNPFITESLVCQSCAETSETRFVNRRPSVFVGHIGRGPEPIYPGRNQPICGPCYRIWAEENKILCLFDNNPDIEALVHTWVKGIGMSSDEIAAKLERIPSRVLEAIPPISVKALMAGVVGMTPGYGLCGRANLGKSQANAALIHACLTRHVTNCAPFIQLPPVPTKLLWMNVPLTVHRWRLDGISPQVAEDVRKAQGVKLLVLDDIGRETRRTATGEDVATGHLDAIITQRDREGLPTIWTSNCDEEELYARYTTPIARRLFRLNPPIWIGED